MRKLIMMLAAMVAVLLGAWADVEVTDVVAKQRYPWNGLVDISCKVSGIEADAGGYEFAVVAVDKDTSRGYTVSTLSIQHNGDEVPDVCANGDYSLLWNAREDMGQVVIERMTVSITLEALAISVGKVQLWEGGPYWADRNVGAKTPEDYGLYFWWGDIKGHRPSGGTFGFNFYLDNSAIYTYGKSVSELQSAGWVTSDGILASAHDAAHVKWGGAWRMPTDAEFSALVNNCDQTRTMMNGVCGWIVRGRGAYASNNIFLPAGGDVFWTSLYNAGSAGYYWSSVSGSNDRYDSWVLAFGSIRRDTGVCARYGGMSVRSVQ